MRGSVRKHLASRVLVYGLTLSAFLLALPLLGSYFLVNTTSLALLRELSDTQPQAGQPEAILRRAQLALVLWDSPASRWAVARAALVAADGTTAAVALGEQNVPLERIPAALHDRIALGYIQQQAFHQAVRFRPSDLYSNYHLWRAAPSAELSEHLRYFPPEAVVVSDTSLRDYARRAAPLLTAANVWPQSQADSFLLALDWQSGPPLVPEPAGIAIGNLLAPLSLNSTVSTIAQGAAFWEWQVQAGVDGKAALFVGGTDAREQPGAVCLIGLWRRPESAGAVAPYAQFVSLPLSLQPRQRYKLTIRYKTDAQDQARPLVALLDYTPEPRFVFTHTLLPETSGAWREWSVAGEMPAEALPLRLIVRNWGLGAVWFDEPRLELQTGS